MNLSGPTAKNITSKMERWFLGYDYSIHKLSSKCSLHPFSNQFQVGMLLYKVHRHFFDRYSTFFHNLFSTINLDARDIDDPIFLAEIEPRDFECLLSVFYPRYVLIQFRFIYLLFEAHAVTMSRSVFTFGFFHPSCSLASYFRKNRLRPFFSDSLFFKPHILDHSTNPISQLRTGPPSSTSPHDGHSQISGNLQ